MSDLKRILLAEDNANDAELTLAALGDQDFVAHSRTHNRAERARCMETANKDYDSYKKAKDN